MGNRKDKLSPLEKQMIEQIAVLSGTKEETISQIFKTQLTIIALSVLEQPKKNKKVKIIFPYIGEIKFDIKNSSFFSASNKNYDSSKFDFIVSNPLDNLLEQIDKNGKLWVEEYLENNIKNILSKLLTKE